MGKILDILKSGQDTTALRIDVDSELERLHMKALCDEKDLDACLIQAFLLARDHERQVPDWVMSRLYDIFKEYFDTKTHPRYKTHHNRKRMQECTIADCFNINNRVFQSARSKEWKGILIDRVCGYKWLFRVGNKAIIAALAAGRGYEITTNENDQERLFERYIPKGYYEEYAQVMENHEHRDSIIQTTKLSLNEKQVAIIRAAQRRQKITSAPILFT